MTPQNIYWVEGSFKDSKGYRACCTKEAYVALANLGYEAKRSHVVYSVDEDGRETIYVHHVVMVDHIQHYDSDQVFKRTHNLAAE